MRVLQTGFSVTVNERKRKHREETRIYIQHILRLYFRAHLHIYGVALYANKSLDLRDVLCESWSLKITSIAILPSLYTFLINTLCYNSIDVPNIRMKAIITYFIFHI